MSSLNFNPKFYKKGCANILQFKRSKFMSFSYLLFPGIHNINLKARQAEKFRMLGTTTKISYNKQAGVSKATTVSGYTVTVGL